jgi:formate-dependent nitrite reductase membrane component NrfD
MNGRNEHAPKTLAGAATLIRPAQGEQGRGRDTSGPYGRGVEWAGKASTYYGLPLIKKAHWGWQIILYFFLGGMSGGSYLVATLADFLGSRKDASLIRAGRYLAFVCVLLSPILLIWDLGRPERFHHMLRVIKLRSPMSLGTWALSSFGLGAGLTTAYQMAHDGLLDWLPFFPRLFKALPVKLIELMGSFFGVFVGSYTGLLLAATAVPIWARAKHILGPLFLTSGLSTALAGLSLILSLSPDNEDTLERLERAEMVTMATELGLISTLPKVLGPLAKPLFKGRTGMLFCAGTIGGGLLLPLLARSGLKLTRRSTPRAANIALSLLVLTGGMILRTVWIIAGRASADDPQATHEYNAMEWDEKR